MSQLAEFLVGTAVIVAPQTGLPCCLALALGKSAVNLSKRRKAKAKRKDTETTGKEAAKPEKVTLSWADVNCIITSKKGDKKQLLQNLHGTAKPGR